jgi:hypothetical protein
MLYETLKWPQIAPFCISSKEQSVGGGADTDPLPFKIKTKSINLNKNLVSFSMVMYAVFCYNPQL